MVPLKTLSSTKPGLSREFQSYNECELASTTWERMDGEMAERNIPPVMELRVAITTEDFERLKKFYCDGLGMEPAQIWNNNGGKALMLELGKANLEIFDETQAQVIDELEAGKRVSGQIRFALQVPDLEAAMNRLLANGAVLVHPPVVTPWGDRNVRLQDPDGMQVTLFQSREGTD
jgi:catechol 2,3-dioxygenase-like lactoylglutathione lyase family enzyme